MNKLILTTASAIIICGCLVYANTGKTTTDNSLEFMNAFKNCDQFSSVDVIEVDGISSKVSKDIIGWDGYACRYQEIIEFKDLGFKSKVNCKFNGEQVREIYGVMLTESEKASKNPEKYKNMTLEQAQKNPVLQVWNKYLGDSSVCKIEM